ncbi:MAG: recombinase family protein [Candidatus Omnitrophota bacterium]
MYITDCIIYIRVSTLEQKDGFSPEAQHNAGTGYCKNKGWSYIIRPELGKSANEESLDNREVLKDILVLAEEKKFKYLYVIDADRLSRNLNAFMAIKQVLLKNDILLVTQSTVTDFKDPTQTVQANLMAVFSEYENLLRGLRFSRGKRIASRQYGLYVGGYVRYGYKAVKKNLNGRLRSFREINEEQYKVFRRVQKLCLDGYSTTKIAVALTSEGILTLTGKPWRAVTILQLLRGEFYLGKKSEDGKTWLIPPLTDKTTFDLVQRQLDNNRRYKSGPRPKNRLLFRGKIVDPSSGRLFTASLQHQKYAYYRHPDTQIPYDLVPYKKKLDIPAIRGDEMDVKGWEWIKNYIKDPDRLKKSLLEYQNSAFVHKTEKELEISTTEKELKRIEVSLDRIQKDFYDNRISNGKRNEYSQPFINRKTFLEDQLLRLKVGVQENAVFNHKLILLEEKIKHIRTKLDTYTFEEKSELLDLLQIRINVIYSTKTGFSCNVTGVFDNYIEESPSMDKLSIFPFVNQRI